MKVIANAFDLPAELKGNFGREENWQRLAELVATMGSFERAFCKAFNVDGFSTSALKNFDGLENFLQWFLWLRGKLQNSGYTTHCAKASDSPKEFVAQSYELIFYLNVFAGRTNTLRWKFWRIILTPNGWWLLRLCNDSDSTNWTRCRKFLPLSLVEGDKSSHGGF